jgi:hypothetical protein
LSPSLRGDGFHGLSEVDIAEEPRGELIVTVARFHDDFEAFLNSTLSKNAPIGRPGRSNDADIPWEDHQHTTTAQQALSHAKQHGLPQGRFSPLIEWMIRQSQPFFLSAEPDLIQLASLLEASESIIFPEEDPRHILANAITETRTIILPPHLIDEDSLEGNPQNAMEGCDVGSKLTVGEIIEQIDRLLEAVSSLVDIFSPLSAQIRFLLARYQLENGNYVEARQTIVEAREISALVFKDQEEYAITFWFLSVLNQIEGHQKAALDARTVFYLRTGVIRLEQERHQEGQVLLKKGIRGVNKVRHFDPINVQIQFFLAASHLKTNEPEKSVGLLRMLAAGLRVKESLFQSPSATEYIPISCSYRIAELVIPFFPQNITLLNINELLAISLLAAGNDNEGLQMLIDINSTFKEKEMYSLAVVSKAYDRLARLYEQHSNTPETPLTHFADAVRMYLAEAYLYWTMGTSYQSDFVSIMKDLTLLIQTRGNQLSSAEISKSLTDLINVVPDEHFLTDPTLRYSFFCFLFPPERRLMACLEPARDSPTMSGFLAKRGKMPLHSWKARFFILQGPFLRYYASEVHSLGSLICKTNFRLAG